jgi:hypothetical protein
MVYGNVVQEKWLRNQDDGAETWVIKQFFGHRCSEKDNQWEVNIEWSSGETSWEPVLMIRKDEPLHL